MFKFKSSVFLALVVSASLFAAGCSTGGSSTAAPAQTANPVSAAQTSPETSVLDSKEPIVNLYTDRHYDIDDAIYEQFRAETGITVNVVKGKSDELIERLKTEGADTEADLFITADVGRLQRAKDADLLMSVSSTILSDNIPENLRDPDSQWFGLTKRARVIVYAKDRIQPSDLSTYADLADPKWQGRLLVRSSDSVYNQTLLASLIELEGIDQARSWAKGVVANFAREPQGGDRDQAKAIVAGEGDIAIMNTYYVGLMLDSVDPEEQKVAEQLGVFFPDQDGAGTHINVSGAGVVKSSKNPANAIQLLEFLSSAQVQASYAQNNSEYPVNPAVSPSELLQSWGTFKEQSLPLSRLGELNGEAVKLFNEIGWK
jgi:iron(III) transport system substrate-binding protein